MDDLTKAIASAEVLASTEREALAGKGNVIKLRVVAPLIQMQAIGRYLLTSAQRSNRQRSWQTESLIAALT